MAKNNSKFSFVDWQQAHLSSNDPIINNFTGAPEFLAKVFDGHGVQQSWEDSFTELDLDENGNQQYLTKDGKKTIKSPGKDAKPLRKTKWGRVAMSGWAAYTGIKTVGGALSGALTDENGRLDLPGIPLI